MSEGERDARNVRVVVVCLGNICRSPMAAAVLRHQVNEAGLAGQVEVASAGTSAWHAGGPADRRAAEALTRNGYSAEHTARQFQPSDFDQFDLVLAADDQNRDDLLEAAARSHAPEAAAAKVHLLREFDPDAPPGAVVPDPYYGGDAGFDDALALIEAACRGVVQEVQRRLGTA